jgi:aromatic-L-amino-acid/L-tryptophan decarboxylase
MDWVAQLLGLDESFHNASGVGGGIIMVRARSTSDVEVLSWFFYRLQGSASESCLTVCIAARERALRLHPGTPFEQMVIVGTTQTHSLGAKAALILGLSFVAIETKEEDAWALRGEALKETLDKLKGEGKLPFALCEYWDLYIYSLLTSLATVATIGSTSTGAIDNIAEITAVAASYPELFVHVDAAWAGVMLALPEARNECYLDAINARSKAVNAAGGICASGEIHSFCTNLHKSAHYIVGWEIRKLTPLSQVGIGHFRRFVSLVSLSERRRDLLC